MGVPRKSSAGIWYVSFSPTVISYICSVKVTASAGEPPTNFTIAGAAAIANPPMPVVSVITESPMSRAASSGPYPGR